MFVLEPYGFFVGSKITVIRVNLSVNILVNINGD